MLTLLSDHLFPTCSEAQESLGNTGLLAHLPLGSAKSTMKNWRQERLLPNKGLVFRGNDCGADTGTSAQAPSHPFNRDGFKIEAAVGRNCFHHITLGEVW